MEKSEAMESTDIWFRTRLRLDTLATAMGAEVTCVDSENYWEWVEADFADFAINISRTHTTARLGTDTRIALRGDHEGGSACFPDNALNDVVDRLQRLGIDPVYAGQWIYRTGNEFDQVVHTRFARPKSTTG